MCGITGFWQTSGGEVSAMEALARRMSDAIVHRGPDDGGTWVDAPVGIALAFRRLAILDLSPLGHQPMRSVGNRFTIIYNGEIYNYLDLKTELSAAGHSFRGSSDTEVLLAGFLEWGVETTLERIAGMFAIAVWDADCCSLTLARDRIGKKPLYYGRVGSTWLFGSELKAFRLHPAFRAEIDRESLTAYFQFGYVPSPRSIYRGIRKLPAGHYITLTRNHERTPVCYWNAAAIAADGQRNPLVIGDTEATDKLEDLLGDAVRRRMISDVPIGAFLSGGLDSSTVVALMQAHSSVPVKTFTIGFDVEGYNEAIAAKAIAAHLGTEHTELYVTPEQARAVIPDLPTIYDEPFADASQIPTFLVSQLARQKVTVALSGDGGDELFAGYNRYSWGPRIWDRLKYVPAPMRRAIGAVLSGVSPQFIDSTYAALGRGLPKKWSVNRPGDKLHKLSGVISAGSDQQLYQRLVSAWHQPQEFILGAEGIHTPRPKAPAELNSFAERMMFWDLITYLPDDILVKMDRASMAVSLEARNPLLDHRLIEWAWRLPHDLKVRNGSSKWLLRQLLERYVPRALVERPKMGFGIPIDHWLRGPLKAWAEEMLSVENLEAGGILRAAPLRDAWQRHLAGHQNEQARLWPVLMFQSWRRRWL